MALGHPNNKGTTVVRDKSCKDSRNRALRKLYHVSAQQQSYKDPPQALGLWRSHAHHATEHVR